MGTLISTAGVLGLGSAALGQLTVPWHSFDGGGGESSGAIFLITATIGQPDAGPIMSGGVFVLTGGFLAGAASIDPGCGSADYNNDGDTGTDLDIEAFFACLAGNCCPACPPNADFNGDGDVGTDLDIEAFFRVLAGLPC